MNGSQRRKTAREILSRIPEEIFTKLSKKYEVDYKVKKLHGKVIFLTMLEALFSSANFSLRNLALQLRDKKFQKYILKNRDYITIDHTAFHYRLNKMSSEYFQEIFEYVKKAYKHYLTDLSRKHQTLIFDSTIVAKSANLLQKCGFQTTGSKNTKQVKFTVGLGEIPEIVKCYTHKKYHSENTALSKTILSSNTPKNQIILFDRGMQHRSTYDKITDNQNIFVSRLRSNYVADIIKENKTPSNNTENKITKEVEAYLYSTGKAKKTKYPYRLIHVKPDEKETETQKKDRIKQGQATLKSRRKKHALKTQGEIYDEIQKEEIVLITNIPEETMSAEEIAEIYRERWKIEVFFRFIKQQLHFSHLLNRTENGMKSIMYITMIYAIILLVYKKVNGLDGYQAVKVQFMLEAQHERYIFVKTIIQSRPEFTEARDVLKPQFF